jgi:phenylpropionate dioxygenase-like ring-hydroxylating dioxygenase large terminal subunit
MMENSFDNAHFSFVHRGTFGDAQRPVPKTYELVETDYGFEAESSVPILNPPAAHRVTGSTAATLTRHLTNRYYLPFARRFGCRYDSGIEHVIYNCATPIDDDRMMLVQWLYRNDSEQDCPAQVLIDWDGAVTAEDREILEATDADACIDTRRRQEFHMPSDKPGLLIRKQLMALLTEHGESEVHRPPLGSPP